MFKDQQKENYCPPKCNLYAARGLKENGVINKPIYQASDSAKYNPKGAESNKSPSKDPGPTRPPPKDSGSSKAPPKDSGSSKAPPKDSGSSKALPKDSGPTRAISLSKPGGSRYEQIKQRNNPSGAPYKQDLSNTNNISSQS